MTIQVNPLPSPRIITIPEADGDSITIQSLVNQIRAWEDDQVNLSYPSLLSASGKDILDAETLVGITARLENAKMKFANRTSPTDCQIYGGNLVAVDEYGDPMNPIAYADNVNVILAKSSSATMVQGEAEWTPAEKTQILNDMAFVKQVDKGRWKIQGTQLILYDADKVTPLRVFNLLDKQGQPTTNTPYERMPVE